MSVNERLLFAIFGSTFTVNLAKTKDNRQRPNRARHFHRASDGSMAWRITSSCVTRTIDKAPFKLGRSLIGEFGRYDHVSRAQAELQSDDHSSGAILQALSATNPTGYCELGSSEWKWLEQGQRQTLRHGDRIALDKHLLDGSVFTFETSRGAAKQPIEGGSLACGDPRRTALGLPLAVSGCRRPCCAKAQKVDSADEDEDEEEDEAARGQATRREAQALVRHPLPRPASSRAPPGPAQSSVGARTGSKRPHQYHEAWQKKRQRVALQNGIALADKWQPDDCLDGFVAMEKYDGHRALWRPPPGDAGGPGVFVSRTGERHTPPPSFAALLPSLRLDGELWVGHGAFEQTSSLLSRLQRSADEEALWQKLTYVIFDAPFAGGPFIDRLARAREALAAKPPTERVFVAPVWPCADEETRERLLQEVLAKGGEGLMLRRASSTFVPGVSPTRDLLKVKVFADAEAIVIRRDPRRQVKKSVPVRCLTGEAAGIEFYITTTDAETKPPGTIVTFVYQHGLKGGMPRHAHIKYKHRHDCECETCAEWNRTKRSAL